MLFPVSVQVFKVSLLCVTGFEVAGWELLCVEGKGSPCRGDLGVRVAIHGQTEEMCVGQNLSAFDLWQLGTEDAPSPPALAAVPSWDPLTKTLQCISKALPRWETTGGDGRGSKISALPPGASCPPCGLGALGSVEVRAEPAQRAPYHAGQKNYPNTHYWLLNNRTSLSFCCWHPFRMIKSVEEPLPAWGTAQLTEAEEITTS